MNQQDEYIKKLQGVLVEEGLGKLRALKAEFSTTLERFSTLGKELQSIIDAGEGVDYDTLVPRVGAQLNQAAKLLARLELLPEEERAVTQMAEFIDKLEAKITLHTVEVWTQELEQQTASVRQWLKAEVERLRQKKVEVEARILKEQESAERKKREEAERIRWKKAQEDAQKKAEAEDRLRIEKAWGQLRALKAEFSATLERFPTLGKELQDIIDAGEGEGVDYDTLVPRVEAQLNHAAKLLGRLELLPPEERAVTQMAEFIDKLGGKITLHTVEVWTQELDQQTASARQWLKDDKKQILRENAEVERKMQEEEERIRCKKAQEDAKKKAEAEDRLRIEKACEPLRALKAEFSSTLERFPTLRKELQSIIDEGEGVDYDTLVPRVEAQLNQTSNLLARLELLPEEDRAVTQMAEFIDKLEAKITLHTVEVWTQELEQQTASARQWLKDEKERILQENAEVERKKQEEAEAECKKREENRKILGLRKKYWIFVWIGLPLSGILAFFWIYPLAIVFVIAIVFILFVFNS